MVSLRVVFGDGGKQADPVTDELITTEYMAKLRGIHELNKLYWHRTRRMLRCRYLGLTDGQVVRAMIPEIAQGNYLVTRASISIEDTAGKIIQTLDMEGEYGEP